MKLKLFGSVLARGEMKLKEKLCQINPIGWEDPKKYNGKVENGCNPQAPLIPGPRKCTFDLAENDLVGWSAVSDSNSQCLALTVKETSSRCLLVGFFGLLYILWSLW
uniref:Uncharacterized protein n=1 Tax=Oryza sativa subsp. japonica TaxID=39947 RepID=Q6H818_ORYSJ|nr:hypothetical protein [Oryza sativa Japonica Group]